MGNPFETAPGMVAGQNLSLAGSRKGPPPLPSTDDILHDWHFGDLSQLSLDTAGLIPATEHGDPIARIDDKGSDPIPLIQTVLAKRPLIDKSVRNVITGKFFAPGHVLHATPAGGGPAAFTVAAFYYLDTPPQDEDNVVFFWDTNNELSIRSQADALPIVLGIRHEFGCSNTVLNGAFTLDKEDFPSGAILQSNSVPEQRVISNFQTAEVTGTQVHNPPDAGRFLGIGASTDDATPQDELNGRVNRIVMWDITLDEAQRNEVKSYGGTVLDIVWA